MTHVLVMRVLFGLFLVNEMIVVVGSTPEEKAQIIYPRFMPLPVLLLLLPFAWAVALPPWIGWGLALIQAGGLGLEVASEIQLSRARAFSIVPGSPAKLQQAGSYRFLENPIYVGMILQMVAWSVLMPVAFIGALLNYEGLRRMVRAERAHLAASNLEHRGIDRVLWG
jgi:protein-S-isoprenylcysteine O-methyltransferase Ste14